MAPRLGYLKPALIHSRFFPALQGHGTKMSSSEGVPSTVFVTDTPKEIKTKINKYAYSGGQETAELQRELGANLAVDVSYEYIQYLMEDDDEIARIGRDYASGKLLTGEVKAILIKEVQRIVAEHQVARAKVTDDVVRHFMDPTRPTLRL